MTSSIALQRAAARVVAYAAAAMLVAAGALAAQSPSAVACGRDAPGVQVLGSGGPYAGGTRASTSYLVWRDGRAVVMVDAGGGAFLRFGESGARLADLALLAISHLHPDHVADLPALLWLSEQARTQPLRIAGPSAGGAFPAFDAFVHRLFDASAGAFPILAGTLGQTGQGVKLDVATLDATVGAEGAAMADGDLEVRAMGVRHGDVPSLAYRVRVGGRTVVFGSDQTASDPRFATFAQDADLLVMHLAIAQGAPDRLAQLHARPAAVGQMAHQARAKRLVLSHVIEAPTGIAARPAVSGTDLAAAVAEVKRAYDGPVETASDLRCIALR